MSVSNFSGASSNAPSLEECRAKLDSIKQRFAEIKALRNVPNTAPQTLVSELSSLKTQLRFDLLLKIILNPEPQMQQLYSEGEQLLTDILAEQRDILTQQVPRLLPPVPPPPAASEQTEPLVTESTAIGVATNYLAASYQPSAEESALWQRGILSLIQGREAYSSELAGQNTCAEIALLTAAHIFNEPLACSLNIEQTFGYRQVSLLEMLSKYDADCVTGFERLTIEEVARLDPKQVYVTLLGSANNGHHAIWMHDGSEWYQAASGGSNHPLIPITENGNITQEFRDYTNRLRAGVNWGHFSFNLHLAPISPVILSAVAIELEELRANNSAPRFF